MFDTVRLRTKRWMLMLPFKGFEIKFQAEQLGAAMAREDDESQSDYYRKKIQDAVQAICAKKNIGYDDFGLIEDELNDYINSKVRAAYDAEVKKIKMQEIVDGRIKIKRVESAELDGTLQSSES